MDLLTLILRSDGFVAFSKDEVRHVFMVRDGARAPPHHEELLTPHGERDQAQRADDDAPPRKQRKAAAGDVT